jgi:hypothetical protein
MAKEMYNIVPESKPVRFRLLSPEPVKETKVMTRDEARKHDRNVEQSVGRFQYQKTGEFVFLDDTEFIKKKYLINILTIGIRDYSNYGKYNKEIC